MAIPFISLIRVTTMCYLSGVMCIYRHKASLLTVRRKKSAVKSGIIVGGLRSDGLQIENVHWKPITLSATNQV